MTVLAPIASEILATIVVVIVFVGIVSETVVVVME